MGLGVLPSLWYVIGSNPWSKGVRILLPFDPRETYEPFKGIRLDIHSLLLATLMHL